jgi:coproporphyrinogen III oxidase
MNHITENIHVGIIIDDCIGSLKFNDVFYTKLYSTYRHPKITLITISQFPMKLSTLMRANADYVFLLKQNGERALKGIYSDYFCFMDYRSYLNYIQENTDNYKDIL